MDVWLVVSHQIVLLHLLDMESCLARIVVATPLYYTLCQSLAHRIGSKVGTGH